MDENVEYDILEDALKRCHSNWHAAQSHGLLTARLAVAGVPAWPRFRNAWHSANAPGGNKKSGSE